MRILVINYEYPPIGGGGGFVVRNILEHLVEMGHSVTIITSGFKGLKNRENVNGVDVIRVPVLFRKKMEVASTPSMLSYVPSSIFRAVRDVRGKMFDIINTHFAIPSGPTGYLLSKIFSLPNVLSIHGGDIFDPSKSLSPHKTPLLFSTVRAMLNTADSVVAQSNDTLKNVYTYYHLKREIDLIPLGIKKPIFPKKTRRDFGLDPNVTIFCTIGRLIARKNINDSLIVLSELKKEHRFKFLIIGEGPERLHLEEMISQLGLEEIVLMLGNISEEEKFQLLDLSDIYLSTATHEGFGLVFLEALECGLPVISYNRGGQTDFLIDGKTGFVVQLRDKETFGKRIVELMKNHQLAKRMGDYNRELVENYYISNCAEKYISLFERIISIHGKQAGSVI